ncbi:MAG: hypothetical protein ACYTGH_17605 [Planctomycetota bacterium]|jgi:anti-sigma28 factor (negative regulator of flagellin synthesis)
MVDHVNGVNPLGNAGNAQRLKKAYQHTTVGPRGVDGVERSSELQKLSQVKGIRLEKVLEVRRQIEAGTYLEEGKLNTALDRAIDDAYGSEEK